MDDMLKMGSNRERTVPSAPPIPSNNAKLPVTTKSNVTRIQVTVGGSPSKLPSAPVAPTAQATQPQLTRAVPPAPTVAKVPPVSSSLDIRADDDVEDADLPTMADDLEGSDDAGGSSNPITRFFGGYWHKKLWTLPLSLLVVAGVVAAVPQTRYSLLAHVLKRSFSVTLVDSNTNSPVTGASITLDGQALTTGSTGKVAFMAPVGEHTIVISKKYYQDVHENIFVGISPNHNAVSLQLVATGRQVPIVVIDKITGKPLSNAAVRAADTEAITNKIGSVNMVLPTTSPTLTATISADGYTTLSVAVQITSDSVPANTFALVPAGHVYFLSNLSGKLDVVSTNLDGSDRKTVLAGTGSEDNGNTVLLASRDWQYLALLSKRDGGTHAKLFLINATTGQLTTIDSNSATFTLIGWSDHMFVYEATSDSIQAWQSGQTVINSYNADTNKVAVIDQTNAQGASGNYIYQNIGFINILTDRVVYGMSWSAYYGNSTMNVGGQTDSILSAKVDGSGKKDLRDVTLPSGTTYTSLDAVLTRPGTLYIQSSVQSQPSVYYSYQYQNNSVTQSSTITDASYAQAQQANATYLLSPTGNETFWSQVRDGKNTLFIGDSDGNNASQIASLSPYAPYGWYTDNYVLVEKGGSELYVMPAAGGTPIKISDYYKPSYNFYGYVGGYGGL